MKTMNKMLSISALCALSLGMAACDDDASGTTDSCTAKCDGAVAVSCENGKEVKTDCSEKGLACNAGKCVENGQADACIEMCNGNTLVTCVNGTAQSESCGDAECKKVGDTYQCVGNTDTDTEPTETCTAADNTCDGASRVVCEGGELKTKPCETNETCDPKTVTCVQTCVAEDMEDACLNDTTLQTCENGIVKTITCEKCENDACAASAKSLVGTACKCEGDSCSKVLTGKEIKDVIQFDLSTKQSISFVAPMAQEYIDKIKDEDKIIYPDFFAAGNKGCEALAAAAPQGMTAGCFRDATISIEKYQESGFKSLIDSVSGLLPPISGIVDLGSIDIAGILKTLSDALAEGIKFSSKDGYCLLATIDLSGEVAAADTTAAATALTAGNFLAANAFDRDGIFSKINTGDHSKAKLDAAKCPEGSVKFVYEVNKTSDKVGELNVGFDMCLKSCAADADCRAGYKCIDIPNGVPADGEQQVYSKACFDEANIAYFEEMTKKFESGSTDSGASAQQQ